mmetsp:Transcript_73713/g.205864  ORF Transcript_73713/g.205864 Transcript_73713/m.205864 type:complete len:313 (-) Transcript_73713:883-1821(-)
MKPFRTHGAAEWGEEPSPSRSVSTASGSTCSDGVPAVPPWWTLVWCHERCHKQGCDGERAAITDTVQDAGATLVCLKKATRFSSWMKQAGQSPYGLLTDWREAKPCMEAIETCSPSDRPAFLVVYCELPRCRERATAWASARPCGATPVRILADLDHLSFCLNALVANLALGRALRGHPSAAPCGGRPYGQQLGVGSSPDQRLAAQAAVAAADEDHLLEARYERMRKNRDSMWLPCWASAPTHGAVHEPWRHHQLQACGVVPAHFQQAPLQPVAAGCVYVRVECAEAPAVQGRGSQQIEAMLVSAMPDHYDD